MKKPFLLFVFLFAATAGMAQLLIAEQTHATVTGKTAMANYTGTSEQLEGSLNMESREVIFKIPLESLKTGNNSRDKDMYKALETKTFPEATFHGKLISDFDLKKETNQKVMIQGDFEIHGVKQPLEVSVDLKPSPEGILFYSFWPIKLMDYDIKRPSIFFMKVADEHKIVIEGALREMN